MHTSGPVPQEGGGAVASINEELSLLKTQITLPRPTPLILKWGARIGGLPILYLKGGFNTYS